MRDTNNITIHFPSNEPNVIQYIEADKLTVEFEDGTTWTLGFLLRKIKAAIEDVSND